MSASVNGLRVFRCREDQLIGHVWLMQTKVENEDGTTDVLFKCSYCGREHMCRGCIPIKRAG